MLARSKRLMEKGKLDWGGLSHMQKMDERHVYILMESLISSCEASLDSKEIAQMPTDYLLFNHGVNTREARPLPTYADPLFELIKHYYTAQGRTLKKIALYWGNLNEAEEQKLLNVYQTSSIWQQLWFRDFREKQLLQFAGDAALYISRAVGSKVADALKDQAVAGLQGYDPKEDRLHIVTHSMGTVILFDILFSARWDPDYMPGHASVEMIRAGLFGTSPNPTQGIRLGSISTMGSPIGFFSLLDVTTTTEELQDAQGHILSTHDITPRLEQFLEALHQELGSKILWNNFVHPGDPIAYPLEKLLPQLVDSENRYIEIQDILTHPSNLTDFLTEPFSQTLFALLHGGEAHNSYWQNEQVAQQIAQAIERAV